MYQTIDYEVKSHIGYVTINRPEALNALNKSVLEELFDVFNRVEEDEDVRAVILTGAGRSFVAGADIAQMSTLTVAEARAFGAYGQKVMNFMEKLETPIIAAVNGFALGGGCELAMACDFRIASSKAKFGQPEVGLGITPGFGGTQRLSKLVGKGMATVSYTHLDVYKRQREFSSAEQCKKSTSSPNFTNSSPIRFKKVDFPVPGPPLMQIILFASLCPKIYL